MKAALFTLFVATAIACSVHSLYSAPSPSPSLREVSVVDVIEYGSYYYAKLADGTLWFISPDDDTLFNTLSHDAPFEMIKSYNPPFPYYFYSPSEGVSVGTIMITEEDTTLAAKALTLSVKAYEFVAIETIGHGLIQLEPQFYWYLENPEDIGRVQEWQEGETIEIARVVRDTGTRYALTAYKLYNIARDEEVLVMPAFL